MEPLATLHETFRDDTGATYRIELYGRQPDGSSWEGFLVFIRRSDGVRLSTPTETTQATSASVRNWAAGLSSTYFDGAFARASRPAREHGQVERTPPPLRDGADRATYLQRLSALEQAIIDIFRRMRSTQLSTHTLFDALPHAHADVVRALEDLEKQQRALVRRAEDGNDWLILTDYGVGLAQLGDVATEKTTTRIDPPKH